MKHPTLYFALLLLTACTKQQIISSSSREGKIYGYEANSFFNISDKAVFGLIDPSTAKIDSTARLPQLRSISNQAMYLPQGIYVVPDNNLPTINRVIRVNTRTNTFDSFITQTTTSIGGLMYSRATNKTYAVQQDSIFEYTVDETSSPKKMQKGSIYPGLGNGTAVPIDISSTAHGFLPYLYITTVFADASGITSSSIKQLNLTIGTYTTIISSSTSQNYYTGIRFNFRNGMIYFLRTRPTPAGVFTELMQLDPISNQMTVITPISDLNFIFLNPQRYSATIHCCKNMYVLFHVDAVAALRPRFRLIDIDKKNVTTINSEFFCQGLFWTYD